jgi:hypothetical protein
MGGGVDQLRLPGPGQLKEGGEEVIGVSFLVAGLLRDFCQDLPLPLLVEDGQAVLVFVGAHFVGQLHPLEEQLQQLVIHGVDFHADFRKFHDYPPIVYLAVRRR